jgi:hypothetical protein
MEKRDRWQSGTVGLRVRGEPVRVTLSAPAFDVAPSEILPAARQLTDAIVIAMQKQSEREGKPVSCRMGCTHCCRQLIPVSEWEARQLSEYVESQPSPRREQLRNASGL